MRSYISRKILVIVKDTVSNSRPVAVTFASLLYICVSY